MACGICPVAHLHQRKPSRQRAQAFVATGRSSRLDCRARAVRADLQIPAGEFTVGSKRIDDDPYGLWTQFDDTELPQQRVWLDAYAIDRHEVSLAEYLSHLRQGNRHPADELQKLIWHVITVHSVSDHTLARWPALYITWQEAARFCLSKGKRLPTEAEWEKAARGPDGQLFLGQCRSKP